jgi:hypothetical protein
MPPLAVRRIRQVDDYLCGAAVAEMILEFRGCRPPDIDDEAWQLEIWDDIEQLTTGPQRPAGSQAAPGYLPTFEQQQCVLCGPSGLNCWGATPKALAAVLNKSLPPQQRVRVLRENDRLVAVDALIKCLEAGAPAAVLVDSGDHWVVASGFRSNKAAPPPVQVLGHALNAVYVVNPSPTVQGVRQLVPAQEFVFSLFGRNDCGVSGDDDRFIVVIPGSVVVSPPPIAVPVEVQLGPVAPVLTAEVALNMAARHATLLLENDDQPSTDPLLRAVAQTPILVQRDDNPEEFYYVVPFVYQGQITSRMAIDGRTGRVKQVDYVEDPGESLPQWRPAEAVQKERPDLVLRKALVWRPSAQSRSLFEPFWLLTRGDQRVYVRASDGKPFDRLTTTGKGR